MVLKIEDIKVKNYERVVHAVNDATKLDCIIAIHNTKLGPALGGVRSWKYKNFKDQMNDVLKLSEAMTLKNSVCGINFGGGKAAINLNNIKKTPELYQSYAEVVELLKGTYYTAGDVNTLKNDLIECSKVTQYVYGINVETSAPTARGLFYAMECILKFINLNNNFKDIHVAISGIGKVGSKLTELLYKAGTRITVSSVDTSHIKKLRGKINFLEVATTDLFKTKCDIISPCALGASINELTKKQLQCTAIVGAANNQLENPETGDWLMRNNIIYSPDYLVNSGGVIAIASEINNQQNLLEEQLKRIGNRLKIVIEESKKEIISTNLIAKRIAWDRINS